MKIQLDILRRENSEQTPYIQSIMYETADENATVATALSDINANPNITDINGYTVKKIRWQCSCLQKKCGACAMVINAKPQLACNARLSEYLKKGTVRIEPLRKFPVIADLVVDRSIMFENLRTLNIWFAENAKISDSASEIAYEASRCLQCGCCLEVCPNFYAGSAFTGMASIIPTTRLITSLPESQKKQLYKAYRKNMYEGCGKSLACRNVCPAGIDIDKLLVNSNAVAVWKIKPFGKKSR